MNQRTQRLTGFLAQHGISIYGTAPSSSIESDPAGYRPSNLLPDAKSLFCLGIPVPKGVFQAGERSLSSYWRTVNVFYRHLDALVGRCAAIIEETGELAVPVFGCFPYDMRGKGDLWGYVSLVNMAVACGMGMLGRNGLLINSTVGPRLLLAGIVTTAELPLGNHQVGGGGGCPDGCSLCQDACPVKAIEPCGKVDRLKCLRHSMKSPLFVHLLKSGEVKESDAELVNHVSGVDDHSMYTCIACVAACPLG